MAAWAAWWADRGMPDEWRPLFSVVAAAGTILFGLFNQVNDYRSALLYAAFLFIPATLLAAFLPEKERS